jgi:hypothetical protein
MDSPRARRCSAGSYRARLIRDFPCQPRVRRRQGREHFAAVSGATLADHPCRLSWSGRLSQIEVVTGDASLTDAYAGTVPADLVLVCGVFGNIPDDDVHCTIGALPQFGPHPYDPWVVRGSGFCATRRSVDGAEDPRPGAFPDQFVGAHYWPYDPEALQLGKRLFTFFDEPRSAAQSATEHGGCSSCSRPHRTRLRLVPPPQSEASASSRGPSPQRQRRRYTMASHARR